MCTPSRTRSAGSTVSPTALQTRCFSLSCSKITGKAACPRLARLAALVGLKGESEESLAKAFIAEIRAMNTRMGIPDRFDCIRKEDIPLMATWAAQEANPVYPVPVIYDETRFARVIERSHHSQ